MIRGSRGRQGAGHGRDDHYDGVYRDNVCDQSFQKGLLENP